MAATHPRLLWPVTIDSTNDKVSFWEDTGGAGTTFTPALPQGIYVPRGGAVLLPTGNFPGDLLSALQTALNTGTNTYSVTIGTTGRVTVTRTGGAGVNFRLNWSTGAGGEMTNIGRILGYSTAADDGPGAGPFTSDYQTRHAWYPEQYMADGRRYFPVSTVGMARSLGGQQYAQQWRTDMRGVVRVDYVIRRKVRYYEHGDAVQLVGVGEENEAFSSGIDDSALIGTGSGFTFPANHPTGFYEWARNGGLFEIHRDVATHTEYITAVIDPDVIEWAEDFENACSLLIDRGERYRVEVPWRPYVA